MAEVGTMGNWRPKPAEIIYSDIERQKLLEALPAEARQAAVGFDVTAPPQARQNGEWSFQFSMPADALPAPTTEAPAASAPAASAPATQAHTTQAHTADATFRFTPVKGAITGQDVATIAGVGLLLRELAIQAMRRRIEQENTKRQWEKALQSRRGKKGYWQRFLEGLIPDVEGIYNSDDRRLIDIELVDLKVA